MKNSQVSIIPIKGFFSDLKTPLSFLSKLAVTASSGAGILIKPISTWMGPVLGFLGQVLGEFVNRLAHDKKREKIKKRIRRYDLLWKKLPKRVRPKFILPHEIRGQKGQGANPQSCISSTMTILAILTGGSAAAIIIGMGATGENQWSSQTSMGLGVGAILAIFARSAISSGEEHYKEANLDSHLDTLKFAARDIRAELAKQGRSHQEIYGDLYDNEERPSTKQNTPPSPKV